MSQYSNEWQDFIAWDAEMVDLTFSNNNSFTESQLRADSLAPDYHLSESVGSEQQYLTSAPPSLANDPSSFGYTVSAPPSINGDTSTFKQMYSTSPYVGTTTASPLIGYGDSRYFGSFDACDGTLSPLSYPQESPILDTRYDRIPGGYSPKGSVGSSPETVFNPYVAGSSHSFSGLDVRASQMLNVGSWMEQPQIIEPIAEADELNTDATPISIPYPHSQSFNESFGPYTMSTETENLSRSRAVTIPQAHRRPASYNAALSNPHWSQRVPPVLSASPVSYRRPRSVALSRSNSRNGSRRSAATPSPTSDLGWVNYKMDMNTNRLAPTSTEGTQGRTPRGRKKGLTAEQRTHAALMRVIGACQNCQRRKEKCDPGTPCRSCLEHYKGDLVNHPCRDRVLSDLARSFLLTEGLGWHPTARSLESFLDPNSFNISTDHTYNIPLYFGFGPALTVPVHAMHIDSSQPLLHEHFIYSWPPNSSSTSRDTHAVLPGILTRAATSGLTQTLDTHLSLLVSHHFRGFPLFCSPLRILRDVYVYFRSLPSTSTHHKTLHQALKVLVLVHIGGDITLPPPESDLTLSQLVQKTMPSHDDSTPTPCFIRSQFGSVMPGLAVHLMKSVLSSLEQLLLNRSCDDWAISLAVMIVVLMTIESIQYHAAKLPYHNIFDTPNKSSEDSLAALEDEATRTLLSFYSACFAGCHARLRPDWEGEASTAAKGSRPEDVFVESVRESMRRASGAGYLARKVKDKRDGEGDMEYFFDRLVAKMLVMKS